MLAAWIALERRPFSLVDQLDFIVTVNRGIEPPGCWIFLPPDISGAPISVLIIYEQFADPLLQASKPLYHSSALLMAMICSSSD
jgi:hypothetical protein